MVGNGKHKWGFSFTRSGSSKSETKATHVDVSPPGELLCPILGSLMSDPVVVPSGQSFERVAAQVCLKLGFSPSLDDGTRPDFSAVIPNRALQTTIISWCDKAGVGFPRSPDASWAAGVVRGKMSGLIRPSERELLQGMAENPPLILPHAVSEVNHRVNRFHSASSENSVVVGSLETPLPLATKPLCYSSSQSPSDNETPALSSALNPNPQEEELIAMLANEDVSEQEKGAIQLRNITRAKPEFRSLLCTLRLIDALKPLLSSRYASVQANATASLVNLSLEKLNKVMIVRSGIIPLLINALKGGLGESQEHAAGALFSLALDDDNKMAIGVLGALSPLLHALRSESERTRHDSALALYNLTLMQTNRIKLVKLGAIPTLLAMVKSGSLASRVLLILCNIAACSEGRSSLLDSNAVGILVGLLRDEQVDSEATRENCVAALYALSHGSLRFKGLAGDAKAVEVLRKVEERGTDRAREKAKRLLEMMKGREGGEEEDLYQASPAESDTVYMPRHRPGGRNLYSANSSDF